MTDGSTFHSVPCTLCKYCLGHLRTLLLVQGILLLDFLSGAEDFPVSLESL